MQPEEKEKKKFQLDSLPDWVKVLIFSLASFAAAGGGSQVLGKDYTPQFEKIDIKLQRIEDNASRDHDETIRLKVEVERLKQEVDKLQGRK